MSLADVHRARSETGNHGCFSPTSNQGKKTNGENEHRACAGIWSQRAHMRIRTHHVAICTFYRYMVRILGNVKKLCVLTEQQSFLK